MVEGRKDFGKIHGKTGFGDGISDGTGRFFMTIRQKFQKFETSQKVKITYSNGTVPAGSNDPVRDWYPLGYD